MADDMMSTLKNLLGDNADEKIQSVLSALKNNSDNTPAENAGSDDNLPTAPSSSDIDALESIGTLKNIIGNMGSANDSRSNLLMSLKPYMRSERQKSIDSAIKILNISKFSGLFKI